MGPSLSPVLILLRLRSLVIYYTLLPSAAEQKSFLLQTTSSSRVTMLNVYSLSLQKDLNCPIWVYIFKKYYEVVSSHPIRLERDKNPEIKEHFLNVIKTKRN